MAVWQSTRQTTSNATESADQAPSGREEVETRKIGRNETRTFQGLFPGCTRVNKKPAKEPDINVSFPMNSN